MPPTMNTMRRRLFSGMFIKPDVDEELAGL